MLEDMGLREVNINQLNDKSILENVLKNIDMSINVLYKKDFIMDVTIQSVNLQLPSSDIQFLKELANRMGWKANTVNSETSKTELDKAILDVKKGNVKNFDTLEEMMNYLDA